MPDTVTAAPRARGEITVRNLLGNLTADYPQSEIAYTTRPPPARVERLSSLGSDPSEPRAAPRARGEIYAAVAAAVSIVASHDLSQD